MTIYQYAKSADPEVLAVAERNRIGRAAFHEKALAFAQAQGVELGTYYRSSGFGMFGVRAIGGDKKPTSGRWKRGHDGYGWMPWANNPLSDEMDSIRFRVETPVGYPELVYSSHRRDGSRYVGTPDPFVVNGVAYVGFNFTPEDDTSIVPEDGGWTEIKASEWHAAHEAYRAAGV